MVSTVLHTLDGRTPEPKRRVLKEIFDGTIKLKHDEEYYVSGNLGWRKASVSPLNDWQKGFLIHAFGDSFAHTYLDDNKVLRSFSFPLGHLFLGHEPDSIAHHLDPLPQPEARPGLMANIYVDALFKFLGGSPGTKAPIDVKDITYVNNVIHYIGYTQVDLSSVPRDRPTEEIRAIMKHRMGISSKIEADYLEQLAVDAADFGEKDSDRRFWAPPRDSSYGYKAGMAKPTRHEVYDFLCAVNSAIEAAYK